MWQTQEILIPGDHPSAAGHFPGNPIMPGALLLDAVVAAVAGVPQGCSRSRNAKFLRPVAHGTALQLRWQEAGAQCSASNAAPARTRWSERHAGHR